MNISAIEELQRELCAKLKVPFCSSTPDSMLGLSKNFDVNELPINGLRHPNSGNTTGWYIWSGQNFQELADFFQPVHVSHLDQECPHVKKYLGLPPGWRFLLGNSYEDIWFDKSLLKV
jgi:hypothetical protein